jgi:hypothetical protein
MGTEDQKPVLLSYIEDANLTSVQQISTVPRRLKIREWTLESWMVILYTVLMNTTVQLN